MARLGDVCVINPKAPPIEDTLLVSFVPMPKVGEEGEFDPSETRPYAEVKKGFTYFAEGDVLFAKITPCMENGKGAVAHNLENGIGYGSTEFHVLRPKSELVLGEWLYYLTTWSAFRKEAERKMTGSAGQKRVPKDFLENYRLTVPSIHEQQQHIQTLNILCTLISLRKQQIAKLDELVKARFVEMFGDCRTNTKGFECQKGIDLFKFSSGKFLPDEKRLERGIPVYGGNGIAWYTDTPLIHFPTIVIGRVGALCGNIHTVTVPAWITDNAIYIKEQKTASYTLEFLSELMRMMGFYQYADFSGQPKITQKPLESLSYIVPPLDLQRKYTAFVAQTDQQKLTIQHSLAQLELLKKALMQKYFG